MARTMQTARKPSKWPGPPPALTPSPPSGSLEARISAVGKREDTVRAREAAVSKREDAVRAREAALPVLALPTLTPHRPASSTSYKVWGRSYGKAATVPKKRKAAATTVINDDESGGEGTAASSKKTRYGLRSAAEVPKKQSKRTKVKLENLEPEPIEREIEDEGDVKMEQDDS
ncbi:hypothetical protein LTR37_001440 [Vermiconidia calcicola]|uniref:Uncharacterized protein n=1 Tax=Vermiconidia calcicola TaxID=1690605 RepID=A0ACC3NWL8_9PEZI|nr:hypothetical protein LTR37_001440 [Vermiconidia calcicola]